MQFINEVWCHELHFIIWNGSRLQIECLKLKNTAGCTLASITSLHRVPALVVPEQMSGMTVSNSAQVWLTGCEWCLCLGRGNLANTSCLQSSQKSHLAWSAIDWSSRRQVTAPVASVSVLGKKEEDFTLNVCLHVNRIMEKVYKNSSRFNPFRSWF